MSITVAALYRFTRLDVPGDFRTPLTEICLENACRGTFLLAREGINGTIAGPTAGIATVIGWIRARLPGCEHLDVKYSSTEKNPFLRMKVRLKKEIVTMGQPDIDPNRSVGTYIEPEDWNALISAPDIVVIDTRNDYEVAIGTFKGAVNPETGTFREFPDWLRDNPVLNPPDGSDQESKPRVAMFCTGGIRCEKATAYLKQQGVAEVYHLKGGILKYLEKIPEEESLWQGECFVFDQRVAVAHGLDIGTYDQCYACRYPITQEDKKSPHYMPGVSCPHCHGHTNTNRKARFAERQRQMTIARQAGREHLGSPAIPAHGSDRSHAGIAAQPIDKSEKK